MVNPILLKQDGEDSLTITLASLADTTGQSSAKETNSDDRPAALVTVKLVSGGSAPTAGDVAEVYLLRDTGSAATDNWPGTNAAFTPENAYNLGSIVFTATTAKTFVKEFDTSVAGPLGEEWGIAIVNNSGAVLAASGNAIYFKYHYPEIQ